MMKENKIYLGDSIYVEVESGLLKLTVNDGFKNYDTIYLHGNSLNKLVNYIKDNFL